MKKEEIIKWIQQSPVLSAYMDEIVESMKSAIALRAERVEGEFLPIGVSRLGGLPDMLPSIEWPTCHNRFLSFLAQINLREAAPFDRENLLPKTGWLLFFYDAKEEPWGTQQEDRGGWKVIYLDVPLNELKRREAPERVEDEFLTFPLHKICYEFMCSLDSLLYLPKEDVDQDQWLDAYMELMANLEKARQPLHHLLGYPNIIQDDMRVDCQCVVYNISPHDYEKIDQGLEDWMLLLQIDSDFDLEFQWEDMGRLYFWMRKQDLASRNFDRVWTILQSY